MISAVPTLAQMPLAMVNLIVFEAINSAQKQPSYRSVASAKSKGRSIGLQAASEGL